MDITDTFNDLLYIKDKFFLVSHQENRYDVRCAGL